MKRKPTVIDLFSGCGGMSWGLHKAGFKVIAGIDNWDIALETFAHNHPGAKTYSKDIRELPPEQVMKEMGLERGDLDCLVGGPPCQGFSKNVPASYRYLEDPRNQLFRDYLAYVEALLPKTLVMENVAELYNAFDGSIRDEIVAQLKKLGYEVEVQVVHTADYGVPQRRRRCVFFASRTGVAPQFPAQTNTKGNYLSAWSAISDLPSIEHGAGEDVMDYAENPLNDYQRMMRAESNRVLNHKSRALKEKQYKRMASLKAGQAHKDLPPELRPKAGYSGAYGRLDFEMPAPTITRWVFHPGSGRFGHPKDIRTITMREAARLHSFSDDFEFLGSYTEQAGQIGNAVPPLLMAAFAPIIKSCLTSPKYNLSSQSVADDVAVVQKQKPYLSV